MKNIHLLPTEKPSTLSIIDSELVFSKEYFINPQHIYITSDEEIKEGDWFYVKTPNIYGGNVIAKSIGNSNGCWADHILTKTTDEKGYHPSHCVKIILTTDQDLIKDGVQSIDDEFLEWLVKNPSCEVVDVKNISIKVVKGYKNNGEIDYYYTNGYEIIIPQEEPKQETLEEFIEEELEGYDEIDFSTYERFIKLGAKWQAERMYSEEEVIELLTQRSKHFGTNVEPFQELLLKQDLKWFEQFKKK
jgi:hypothetical protein